MKVMVTGHRPPKIGGYQTPNATEQWVRQVLRKSLVTLGEKHGPLHGITGMALGVDLIYAEECRRLGVPYTAAVPFEGQESRWPEESQNLYHTILKEAKDVVIVDQIPSYHSDHFAGKLILRNKWMIDHSKYVLAVWDGSKGGTEHAVRSSQKKGLKVALFDPSKRTASILEPIIKTPKDDMTILDILS